MVLKSSTPYLTPHLKWIGIPIIITIALVFLSLFDPAASLFYPPCPFNKLTGFYCPGCGSLRSLNKIMHGHPIEALCLNPLMTLFLPLLGYAFFSDYLRTFRKQNLPNVFSSPWTAWILFGIILAFWILRNIPLYPFSLLAP